MIQKVLGDDRMNAKQVKSMAQMLQRCLRILKMIHVLEGVQQAEHLRILNMYEQQSTKISDSQRKNGKLIRGFQKLLCLRFSSRILA